MYNNYKEKTMETFINLLQKVFIFEKEPQKIGLSQFKEPVKKEKTTQKIRFCFDNDRSSFFVYWSNKIQKERKSKQWNG